MESIPDSAIHWLTGVLILFMGGLYIFLLKRTFTEFEGKIGSLFKKMEDTITEQNNHKTEIKLIEHRVTQLEKKQNGRRSR